jgi:hypothetical protein
MIIEIWNYCHFINDSNIISQLSIDRILTNTNKSYLTLKYKHVVSVKIMNKSFIIVFSSDEWSLSRKLTKMKTNDYIWYKYKQIITLLMNYENDEK